MGIRIAVIDTPPAITQSISHVVAHADLGGGADPAEPA